MRSHNALVGAFILVGVGLFVLSLFLLGNRHDAFARHSDFYAEFADLDGLEKGSRVRVGGMNAGQILAIDIPTSPSSGFRVRFRIDDRLRGLVRRDSIVTIDTSGVVGETFLNVHPGGSAIPEAPTLSMLSSKAPLQMSALFDQGMSLVTDADGAIRQVSGKLSGALDSVTHSVHSADDLIAGIQQGHGTAGMLLRDEHAAAQVRGTLDNIRDASSNLDQASLHTDQLVQDITSRKLPEQIDDAVSSVNRTLSDLGESTDLIHRSVEEVLGPDKDGISASQNIKDTISNMNSASGNMAEDAEAIKRSFFLRGFFRNRGYYNLSDMSPSIYRRNPLFINPANRRTWISAEELFVLNADGAETLSLAGKHLLDAALAHNSESIFSDPMVIEGYSAASDSAQRVSLSHARAALVRGYLEQRFFLQHDNLGIVALGDVPPDGLGHATWNGICITAFARHK